MEKKIFHLVTILLSILSFASFSLAVDEYWVSFSEPPEQSPGPGIGKYLMKIDALGNIVVPPKIVISNLKPTGESTTISHGGFNRINLWTVSTSGLFRRNIFRAVIEKSTLNLVSLQRTPIQTSNFLWIQTTQKDHQNFLAVQVLQKPFEHLLSRFVGLKLSVDGEFIGPNWFLTPDQVPCVGIGDCGGLGVSADGKVFFFASIFTHPKSIVFQSLRTSGRPDGEGKVNQLNRGVTPMDMSNLLPGRRRYLLYRIESAPGDPPLLLQIVDNDSLEFVGDPIKIAETRFGPQIAAIDPLGHFILYKKPNLNNTLVYQALDATGHRSGQPKNLSVGNLGNGIDILKD